MKYEDAIRKARAALVLANSGSTTPGEAARAAAYAASVMARFNLTEAALMSPDEDEETGLGQVADVPGSRKMKSWIYKIAEGMAETLGCAVFYSHEYREKIITVTGRKRDVETCVYLTNVIALQIAEAANVQHENALRNSTVANRHQVTDARRWKESFKLGAGITIYHRLIQQHRAAQEDLQRRAREAGELENGGSAQAALLVIDRRAKTLARLLEAWNLKTGRGSAFEPARDGLEAGRRTGRAINLNRRAKAALPARAKAIES